MIENLVFFYNLQSQVLTIGQQKVYLRKCFFHHIFFTSDKFLDKMTGFKCLISGQNVIQSPYSCLSAGLTSGKKKVAGHRTACSLGLSATSQQCFSLRRNQPPATSQQYFSLRTNQHQPSATSQPNRLETPVL
jgi:hypothetical protein